MKWNFSRVVYVIQNLGCIFYKQIQRQTTVVEDRLDEYVDLQFRDYDNYDIMYFHKL